MPTETIEAPSAANGLPEFITIRSVSRHILWLRTKDDDCIGIGSSSDTDQALAAKGVTERTWRCPRPEQRVRVADLPEASLKVLKGAVDNGWVVVPELGR